ncbi:conjugative transfer signal peptidase TraF [Brucella intermedia]|uniref:conjugative transfer signal peptidase TraF n=1 Tax=Brucella intermedia TaxID=94625 RepID=UPI00224A7E81|nr:conjugative transfer signal peptidase TraF [Brucella intermedia]
MTDWRTVLSVGAAVGLLAAAFAAAIAGGYRLNLTPSEPLGLWCIEPLERNAAVGDLVFICPPPTAPFMKARDRGYLRRGLCPGGLAPLIKTVIALPGQRINIAGNVAVDGTTISASTVQATDGEGRPVDPFSGGIVPADHVFLHSSFASSYDSRYFGPIPAAGLLGLARPVVTFEP